MTPEKLTGSAAKDCLQMVVWLIEESHWTYETLDDIAGVLVEFNLLDPDEVDGDIDLSEWEEEEEEDDKKEEEEEEEVVDEEVDEEGALSEEDASWRFGF